MMNKNELNDEMLEQVNGGTFTPNRFAPVIYQTVGVNVTTHFFERDEFVLEDGTKITQDEADDLVYDKYGFDVAEQMSYGHCIH